MHLILLSIGCVALVVAPIHAQDHAASITSAPLPLDQLTKTFAETAVAPTTWGLAKSK